MRLLHYRSSFMEYDKYKLRLENSNIYSNQSNISSFWMVFWIHCSRRNGSPLREQSESAIDTFHELIIFCSWAVSLISFFLYYVIFSTAFLLRPYGFTTESITDGWINRHSETIAGRYEEGEDVFKVPIYQLKNGSMVNWSELRYITSNETPFFQLLH